MQALCLLACLLTLAHLSPGYVGTALVVGLTLWLCGFPMLREAPDAPRNPEP